MSLAKMSPEVFADLFHADGNLVSHRYTLIWCAANKVLGSDWWLAVPLIPLPSATASPTPLVDARSPSRYITVTTKAGTFLTRSGICSADAQDFPDVTIAAPRTHKTFFTVRTPAFYTEQGAIESQVLSLMTKIFMGLQKLDPKFVIYAYPTNVRGTKSKVAKPISV